MRDPNRRLMRWWKARTTFTLHPFIVPDTKAVLFPTPKELELPAEPKGEKRKEPGTHRDTEDPGLKAPKAPVPPAESGLKAPTAPQRPAEVLPLQSATASSAASSIAADGRRSVVGPFRGTFTVTRLEASAAHPFGLSGPVKRFQGIPPPESARVVRPDSVGKAPTSEG